MTSTWRNSVGQFIYSSSATSNSHYGGWASANRKSIPGRPGCEVSLVGTNHGNMTTGRLNTQMRSEGLTSSHAPFRLNSFIPSIMNDTEHTSSQVEAYIGLRYSYVDCSFSVREIFRNKI